MDVRFIPFAFPGLDSVGCAFGARSAATGGPFGGGNISYEVGDDEAAVRQARVGFKEQLGFDSWQEVKQVHGEQMLFEPESGTVDEPGAFEADGMATSVAGRALVIKTADCQPILLAHESGRFVAALHVGWRGNVLNFPASGVRAFCEEYDIAPAELLAVRGPSLGPGRSEFTKFETEFGEKYAEYYDPATNRVNLWRLTRDQLVGAGLRPDRIHGLDLCTMSLPELFFSYRREQTCGRQASFIWIKG